MKFSWWWWWGKCNFHFCLLLCNLRFLCMILFLFHTVYVKANLIYNSNSNFLSNRNFYLYKRFRNWMIFDRLLKIHYILFSLTTQFLVRCTDQQRHYCDQRFIFVSLVALCGAILDDDITSIFSDINRSTFT